MMFKSALFFIILFFLPFHSQAVSCDGDSSRQKNRSLEIQKLKDADQKDRKPPINWKVVSKKDEVRRKRIAEIFAEGCITTAEDYLAAALVFQHGTSADHFFQTFLWAMRADKLGAPQAKHLMALGIDRYLVNKNQKQLFGSQAFKVTKSECWCLDKIEKTFPNSQRKKYFKKSIQDQMEWVNSMNREEESCREATFCTRELKDSPVGSVPGFW